MIERNHISHSYNQNQKIKEQNRQQNIKNYPQKIQLKCPRGSKDYYSYQMQIRRKVIDIIVQVFKKHGAVQIDTPLFQQENVLMGIQKYGEDSKLIYYLEKRQNEKYALRYDLTVPFSRFMAMNPHIQKIKRFHIGKVYRKENINMEQGRYSQFYQCDFDIAGQYDPMIPDAQILAIMQEVLETLDIKDFIVRVNHRKILEEMIKQAKCNIQNFYSICSSIDKLDKVPWPIVKQELMQNQKISQKQADILGQLIKHKGSPFQLLKKFSNQNFFQKTKIENIQAFNEMKKLFTYLNAMDRIKKVTFDLSLARGLNYYTGLIFQIVLQDKNYWIGSISGGGRYNNLIGRFSNHHIPSVGGTIGIQRLFSILQEKYKTKIKISPCEILVGANENILIEQKLKILSLLWKLNIKAEILYQENSKPHQQIKYAIQNNIPMILWISDDWLESKNLKLQILQKNCQIFVSLNDLQTTLLSYIHNFRKHF